LFFGSGIVLSPANAPRIQPEGQSIFGRSCDERVRWFFFVDGAHIYEYCKPDSEKCLALGGGAGTFMWHDVDQTHPGVVKFILEWRNMGRNIYRVKDTALAYWKSAGTD
jgi:hypothetical protein